MKHFNFSKLIISVMTSLSIAFCSVLIMTCQPGLGTQIDTKNPSITIKSPATKSTLNGDFTITGTASDDIGIQEVNVSFKNRFTNEVVGPYTATVTGTNWSLSITPRSGGNSIHLSDGDYIVTAVALDKYNHQASAEVVYTIDTTPPTIMVNSPTTYEDPEKQLITFSRTVTIKGEVYDSSYISSVYVYILDKDGNEVASTKANGTTSFSASFDENNSNLEDYSELGEEKGPYYYYYIVATDEGGNSNSYFFHRTDIAKLSADLGISFPLSSDIGMLDQKEISNIKGVLTKDILDMKQIKLATPATASVLLKPGKYPYFAYTKEEQNKVKWSNVSSLADVENNKLAKEGSASIDNVLAIGSGVSVFGTVLPTSDSSTQTDFHAWIAEVNDARKEKLRNLEAISNDFIVTFENKGDRENPDWQPVIEKDNDLEITELTCEGSNPQAIFESSGGSFNLEIKSKDPADDASKDWPAKLFWIKVAYRTDTGGQLQDDAIFYVSSDNPRITETSFAGNASPAYFRGYMTKNTPAEKSKLSGVATTSDGVTPAPSCRILRNNVDISNSPSWTYDSTNGNFTYTLDTNADGEYSYEIIAASSDSITETKKASVQRVVVIDNVPPTISANVSPAVSTELDEIFYVNGTINVSFVITDDRQIDTKTYRINYEDGGWSAPQPYTERLTIDTKLLKGGKNTDNFVKLSDCIELTATDKAGNVTVCGGDAGHYPCMLDNYIVNQQSDIPVIKIDQVLYEIDDAEHPGQKRPVTMDDVGAFDTTGDGHSDTEINIYPLNGSISVRLDDDDGIKALYVFISKPGVGLPNNGLWTRLYQSESGKEPSSVTPKCPVAKLGYGKQDLRFFVIDKNYPDDGVMPHLITDPNNKFYGYDITTSPAAITAAASSSYNCYFNGDGYGCVDDNPPTLNVTTELNKNVNGVFTISGTARDHNKVVKIDFVSEGSDGQNHVFYTFVPEYTAADCDATLPAEQKGTVKSWNVEKAWSVEYDLNSTITVGGNTISKKIAPITIIATDGIGRTTASTFTYNSDQTPPQRPKFVDLKEKIFYGAFLEDYTANTTNTLTIFGSATDTPNDGDNQKASGVDKVRWGLVSGQFDHQKLIVWTENGGTSWKQCPATGANAKALMAALKDGPAYPSDVSAHTWHDGSHSGDEWYWYSEIQTGLYFCYHYDEAVVNKILGIIETGTEQDGHTRRYTWNEQYPVNLRDSYTDKYTDAEGHEHIDSETAEHAGVDTFWMLSCSMPDSVMSSGDYTIVFQALDKVGNESKPLIYHIAADNDRPQLTIKNAEGIYSDLSNDTIYTNGVLTIEGKITEANPVNADAFSASEVFRSAGESYFNTSRSFAVTSVPPEFDENGDLIGKYDADIVVDMTKSSWNEEVWTWTNNFNPENANVVDGIKHAYIFAKDKAWWSGSFEKNSATLVRNIVLDTTKPRIEVTGIKGQRDFKPSWSDVAIPCVNGTVTVKTLVNDQYIESAWYCTKAKQAYADEDAIKAADVGDTFCWEPFETEELTSGKDIVVDTRIAGNYYTVVEDTVEKNYLGVVIKAVDKAGNVSYWQENPVVDQDSDLPTIDATNMIAYDLLPDSYEGKFVGFKNDVNNSPVNVFNSASKNIILKLEDDDGLKSIQVKYGDALGGGEYGASVPLSGKTSEIYSYQIPNSIMESYGRHFITIKVSDINNVVTEYQNLLAIDDGAPELTVNAMNEFVPKNLTLSGKVVDKNFCTDVYISDKDLDFSKLDDPLQYESFISDTLNSFSPTPRAESIEWSQPITLNNFKGSIHVYAVDSLGHRIEKIIPYKVDDAKPVLTLDSKFVQEEGAILPVNADDGTLRITGTLEDFGSDTGEEIIKSGLNQIRYKITANSTAIEWSDNAVVETTLEGSLNAVNGKVVINADITELAGTQYIHIAGSDIAGNWSDEKVVKIALDAADPTISVTPAPALNGVCIVTSDQTFTLTIGDDYSLDSVKAAFRDGRGGSDGKGLIGTVVAADMDIQTEEDGSKSAEVTVKLPSDTLELQGNRDIVFTVTDACGKSSSYTGTYQLDWTPPTIAFTNIESDAEGARTFFTNSDSSQIKVNLLYNDIVSGLKTLTYKFQFSSDDGANWVDKLGDDPEVGVDENVSFDHDYDGSSNGSLNISMKNLLSGTVPGLETTDGLWRLVITATDASGNESVTTSPKYWVDQNNPIVGFTTKLNAIVKNGNDLVLDGFVYDKDHGKVERVDVTIFNSNYTSEQEANFRKTFTLTGGAGNGTLVFNEASDDESSGYPMNHSYYTFHWDLNEDMKGSPFIADGKYTITMTAYDVAGNSEKDIITTACDNDPPVLEFTRPYAMSVDKNSKHSGIIGDENYVTGSVTVAGAVPGNGETGGMGEIFYQLGKQNLVTLYDSEGNEIAFNPTDGLTSKKIAKAKFNENEVYINGSTNFSESYLVGRWVKSTMNYNWSYDFNSVNIKDAGFADNVTGEVDSTKWRTYLYVVARDLAGNINFAVYPINIDTDTDKPQVTITAPDPTAEDKDRVFGGSFSVMGNATDDNGIGAVFMQVEVVHGNYDENGWLRSTAEGSELFLGDVTTEIDPKRLVDNDGTYTEEISATYFQNKNYWYKVKLNSPNATSSTWRLKINNRKVDLDPVTGNSVDNESGSLRIFDNEALKNYYTSDWQTSGYDAKNQSELIIRIRAIDTKDSGETYAILGAPESVALKIDAGAPSITLTQFPDPNQYIKGSFPYVINIEDDGTISDYSVIATGSINGDEKTYVIKTLSNGNSPSYTIEGSLDSVEIENKCGNFVTITVTATDGQGSGSSSSRSFYIDNTAPTFNNAKVNGQIGSYYLIPDTDPKRGAVMNIESHSAIINGWVSEDGSGVDYVLLYFTRGEGEETRIYTAGANAVDKVGIPYKGTVEMHDKNNDLVTVYMPVTSLAAVNKNAGNITYNGTNYESGTRTPYIVVDTVEIGMDYSENGDRDGYNESLSANGVWYVDIDSAMLDDGNYKVNYVVVDKAGNARYFADSMRVINHVPEIISLDLNTDLRGIGGFVDSDKVNYVIKRAGSHSTDSFDLKDSDLTDDTHFKTRNYRFSIKFNINEVNNGITGYYLKYTDKNDSSTKILCSATSGDEEGVIYNGSFPAGITWDDVNKAYIFAGDDCPALSPSGNSDFYLWMMDTLPLSSIEYKLTIAMENSDKYLPMAQLLEFNTDLYHNFYEYGKDKTGGGIDEADWEHYAYENDLESGSFDPTIGHIEPRNALISPYKTAKPTLSGKVWIRGEVLDDQKVSAINLMLNGVSTPVAHWSGNTLVADNDATGSAAELHQIIGQYGHYVEFAYLWDTASIEDVAANNVNVSIVVTDAAGKTSTAYDYSSSVSPNTRRQGKDGRFEIELDDGNQVLNGGWGYNSTAVDVAPYITKITTSLSGLNKKVPSIYDRTALGHYPVRADETFVIYGFNLTGGTIENAIVKANSTDATALDVTPTGTVEQVNYKLPSGALVVKVSGVDSINNKNDNTLEINKKANGNNNNNLTDDVVVDVWEINPEAGKPTNGPLTQPIMAINQVNKQVGFAFANGSLRFSMGSLDKSYDFWEYGLDFWTSIGFAYDANGNSFGTAAGGDINATKADSFGFFTSRWTGKGYTASSNGHNNGTGQLRLELIGQSESTFTNDTVNINKERIKSPSIATTVASADATDTNVYLAYYDEINNEIRFKWGIISDSDNIVRKGRIYYAGQDSYYNSISDTTSSWETGLFADYYGPKDSDGSDNNTKDTTTKTVSLTQSKVVKDLPYTLEYVSLIAGQTTDKKTFVPGASGTKYTANTAVMTRDNKPVCAGPYVCIAAKYQGGDTYNIGTEENPVSFTDDLVVAVWYDATNNQMLYSYNTAPQKIKAPTYKGNNYYRNNNGTISGIDSFSQSATGWSTPVAVFGEGNGIGEYCKVALDADGKVHIACYDNANADVWYAYLDNYASPANAKTCAVDSFGIIGTELNLDVALKDGKPVPYISYYGSSCARPKVAYWASNTSIATATTIDGAEEDLVTGLWETSVIPTASKISIDHINVGVWKDSSGNLTDSKKTDGNVGTTSAGTNNGMVYGNGTANPFLGYAITKGAGGFIETAQMR